jgi:hypothetical protein
MIKLHALRPSLDSCLAHSLGLALVLLAATVAVVAEEMPTPRIPYAPRHYVCSRANAPLTIDGRLDESSWKNAVWTDLFVDIEGSLRPAPRFETHAKLLWDSTYLYVGAELLEPDIWGTLTERDAVIYHDNDFEVFIDPDGDTHEYYELELNALNTVWDLLLLKPYRDGGPAVNAWDIQGLKTAVVLHGTLNQPGDTDTSWTVEIALPWKVLAECAHRPSPPSDGDQWRINFSRVEWHMDVTDGHYRKSVDPTSGKPLPEDNWVWSPQGLIAMHYPEMWGVVQFTDAVAGSADTPFAPDPSDPARWQFRRLFYAERNFNSRTGRFTSNLADLNLGSDKPAGFQWPPAIEATSDLFEARAISLDGATRLTITQDGRICRESK